MPKIIVTSTFRKGGGAGKKGSAGGLLKYMGTREGVKKLPLSQVNLPATKRQKSLIESVIKRIPETVEYPEYQHYLDNGIKGTANDFLNAVIQQSEEAEKIGKLVSYMAERPGVVKLGKHGLFSQTDDPINLDVAAEKVGSHEGYIWTHIVSLHREDAERLGYNNADAWKSLVRRNVTTIAEAHKIPLSDLQWYAAFHDTGHHPHIHLMVYSKGQEGYLSKQSIDNLRSCFGNDIFKQEQYHLFQLQTGLREDIKEKSEQKVRDLIAQAEAESSPSEQLQFLFVKLRKQLEQHKGKQVYGYLPKEIKAVMEMPLEVELNISESFKKSEDDDSDPIRPRFYEEESILKILSAPASPPIVIHHKEPDPHSTIAVTKGIIGALARLIGDKCMAHRQSLQGQIDHRLKQQINEKKLAMGLKIESTQKASYQTEEEYEQSM